MVGIYVHIPFCLQKCLYCDFNSHKGTNEEINRYTNALITQIRAFSGTDCDSIFFGGGTPSILPVATLDRIMQAIRDTFNVKNAEITLEMNPKTTTDFQGLRDVGFNRLSIGMQSANDDELRTLGRIHTFADFVSTYNMASKYFSNINIDTMFALPNQNLAKWQYTLGKVVDLSPSHISAYSLIVEDQTPFYNMNLSLPSEDEYCEMQEFTVDFLGENGYKRYEISNYGEVCKHNLKYWNMDEYVGFGAGSHSFYGNNRYENIYDVNDYIATPTDVAKIPLTQNDLIGEFCFLALRTTKGIDTREFKRRFDVDFDEMFSMKRFVELKLMTLENNCYALTTRGFMVSNEIMTEFV